MPRPHNATLESLFVSSSRLTRAAAQNTGNPVSVSTWTTLSVLDVEGPKRVGELARLARISQPGMTKLLQNLVVDEWVLRIADVEDSRAWLIDITPRGRAAIAAWRIELASALGEIFTDLSGDEWATLETAAGILARHIDPARTGRKEAVA